MQPTYLSNLVILHKTPIYLYSIVKRVKKSKMMEMETIGVHALSLFNLGVFQLLCNEDQLLHQPNFRLHFRKHLDFTSLQL